MKRMWINQPSTLQLLHSRHGENVLAVKEGDKHYTIYLLNGNVISMLVPLNILSRGWK